MLTENGIQIDYEALDRIAREADVITIGFSFTEDRLLVDTRTDETVGPLVTPVAPVQTVQDRYAWLGRHRPSLGAPRGFSFFVWPQTIRALLATDALALLRGRLEQLDPGAADELVESLAVFGAAELDAIRAAIRGEGHWRTIWPVDRPGPQEPS